MEGEEEGEKKEEEEDDYDEEEEEEEDQEDERRADKSWPLVNEHWLATVSGVLSLFLFLNPCNLLSVSLCPATSAFVPSSGSLSPSPTALASSASVLNE